MDRQSRRKIPRNTLRLLSLFIALVMWISMSGRIRGQGDRVVRIFSDVALVQQGIPSDMKLSSEYYQISVTLSGREFEMKKITSSDIDVRLDLSDFEPGPYNIPLTPNNVGIPSGLDTISVEDIQPRTVRLTLERKIRKNVRVVVSTRGHPDLDYELVSVSVTPPMASIEGPVSQVEELSVLVAEPVNIDGARANVSGRVRFDYTKQVPRDTTILNLNELTYTAVIKEIVETRSLGEDFEVSVRPEGREADVEPKHIQLRLTGPVSILNRVDPSWFTPVVNLPADSGPDTVAPVETDLQIPQDSPEIAAEISALIAQLSIEWSVPEVRVQ